VSAQTGVIGRYYENSDINDFNGWIIEGAIRYQLNPKVDIELNARRDLTESISIGEAYYESNRVALVMNYQITPLITANSRFILQYSDYPSATERDGESKEREDWFTFVKAGLTYAPFKNIQLGVNYAFRDRNSNFSSLDYVDHFVEGSITYQF